MDKGYKNAPYFKGFPNGRWWDFPKRISWVPGNGRHQNNIVNPYENMLTKITMWLCD